MIKINRPADAPVVLKTQGVAETQQLCAEYDAGKRVFEFKDSIYAHPDVKQALIDAQLKKCCFCEHKAGTDGDIEHFRPKSASCQSKGSKLIKPGYYWLAYEWNNLLLCCSTCNQRFKRNLFPLANASKRARSHHDPITDEEPLFINPCEIDPEQHIGFRREIPYPIDDSNRGKVTIDALQLDRPAVNERRLDHLVLLIGLAEALTTFLSVEHPDANVRKQTRITTRLILDYLQNDKPYSSMARCAASDSNWFELVARANGVD